MTWLEDILNDDDNYYDDGFMQEGAVVEAIHTKLLEAIGEDEAIGDPGQPKSDINLDFYRWEMARNQLRAEVRQKLEIEDRDDKA